MGEVEEKVEYAKGLLSPEGAAKVLAHIKKNKAKYGNNIYDEYYAAVASGDKERIRACFKQADGKPLPQKKQEE